MDKSYHHHRNSTVNSQIFKDHHRNSLIIRDHHHPSSQIIRDKDK
jgi:hypothetical protein